MSWRQSDWDYWFQREQQRRQNEEGWFRDWVNSSRKPRRIIADEREDGSYLITNLEERNDTERSATNVGTDLAIVTEGLRISPLDPRRAGPDVST